MNIGIVTGSGFYEFSGLAQAKSRLLKTSFGPARIESSSVGGHVCHFIARHGAGHSKLPNMINYRSNISALKKCGVSLVIGTSIMGIIDPAIPLGHLLLFNDLYFPSNSLPSGEACSMFSQEGEKGRGHYIFSSPFSTILGEKASAVSRKLSIPHSSGLVHAHACGPRFNSKAEVRGMRAVGCATVSQTVGPEAVLAGECGIPYLLLGFSVDYANGVADRPTPVEELNRNMTASKDVFTKVIMRIIDELREGEHYYDNGFVYRFE